MEIKRTHILIEYRYPQRDQFHWKGGRTTSSQDSPSVAPLVLKQHPVRLPHGSHHLPRVTQSLVPVPKMNFLALPVVTLRDVL